VNVVIPGVLSSEMVSEVRELLANFDPTTADENDPDVARELKERDWWEHSLVEERQMTGFKKNREHTLQMGHPNAQKTLQLIAKEIMENKTVAAMGLIDCLFPPRFNRYDVGHFYDDHCDEPIARDGQNNRLRADLAFTVWLSDPDEYSGGELVVKDGMSHPSPYKLNAGDLLLYPSIYVHRVNEVKTGTRFAVVGWAQSLIPDLAARAEIIRVNAILDEVARLKPANRTLFTKLEAHRNYLIRLWSY
jgi:PKHD-type hydroxylase